MADFKVLLVNCNTMMDTLVTAGIGILSACLKSEGIEVELFDTTFYRTAERTGDEARANVLQVKKTDFAELGIVPDEGDVVEDFAAKVAAFKPDLIGLSCIEVTYPLGVEMLRAVRGSGIPTILGGAYATFAAEIAIREPALDMVCVGEGERAVAELCRKMRAGEDVTAIPNIWAKVDGKVHKNPVGPPIPLPELPYQDWEIYDKRRFWKPMGGRMSVTGTFEMNRGCPYTCTFCINSGFDNLYGKKGGYYREQDIPRLVDEMVEKKETYGLGFVYLVAESFLTTTRARIEEFGRLYAERVGLPFWVEARPESITRAKVAVLVGAGCEGISIGLESGNYDLRRKVLGRNVTNETILRAFHLLADSGIRVSANNVIGFPTETREMIFDTIELNRHIDTQGVMVTFFSPYKGCVLRETCEANGYLAEEDVAEDYRIGPSMDMPQLGRKELTALHRTFPLYVKFPKSEWPVIRSCEEEGPEADALYSELAERYTAEFMG